MFDVLAQRSSGWEQLIYVLVIVVIPALSALGKKLRERFGSSENAEPTLLNEDENRARPAVPPTTRPLQSVESRASLGPQSAQTPNRPPAPPLARPMVEVQQRSTRGRPVVPTMMIEEAKELVRRKAAEHAQQQHGHARMRREPVASAPPPPAKKEKPLVQERTPRKGSAPAKATKPVLEALSASDLRTAVILSEVLAPPLALREQQSLIPGLD